MNSMRLLKLKFKISTDTDTKLPVYLCSTIRGALGYALTDICCDSQEHDCKRCDNKCIYDSIFKNQSNIAVPYIIESDEGGFIKAGRPVEFSVTLIGIACDSAQLIIAAVRNMLLNNFARQSASFRIDEITEVLTDTPIEKKGKIVGDIKPYIWTDSNSSFDEIRELKLHFITPFRVKGCENMEFRDFMTLLFNRISELMRNYCGSDLYMPYHLIGRFPNITAHCNLRGKTMTFESKTFKGRVGTVAYSGDISEYIPYIKLGELIHFGKTISRGFGRYETEELKKFF